MAVYVIWYGYYHWTLKVKFSYKRILLFGILVVTIFPMIRNIYAKSLFTKNYQYNTLIVSKSWIENHISVNNKLFYFGFYPYMPPIRAKNRISEDLRRDQFFNESLKKHYNSFLSSIADSNYYHIEDFSGRYWWKNEFEDFLNFDYIKQNDFKYIIYSPSYFERFELKGFEHQKSIVDKMVQDIKRNSKLLKEFRAGGEIVNGPTIKIYKMIY